MTNERLIAWIESERAQLGSDEFDGGSEWAFKAVLEKLRATEPEGEREADRLLRRALGAFAFDRDGRMWDTKAAIEEYLARREPPATLQAQFPKPGDPPFDATEVARFSSGPSLCLYCGQEYHPGMQCDEARRRAANRGGES